MKLPELNMSTNVVRRSYESKPPSISGTGKCHDVNEESMGGLMALEEIAVPFTFTVL